MARRSISIDEKIEQQQKAVFQLKDRYDAALAELDRLQQKRNELRNKELLKAIESSDRTYDEIIAFLKNENEEQPGPHRELIFQEVNKYTIQMHFMQVLGVTMY